MPLAIDRELTQRDRLGDVRHFVQAGGGKGRTLGRDDDADTLAECGEGRGGSLEAHDVIGHGVGDEAGDDDGNGGVQGGTAKLGRTDHDSLHDGVHRAHARRTANRPASRHLPTYTLTIITMLRCTYHPAHETARH